MRPWSVRAIALAVTACLVLAQGRVAGSAGDLRKTAAHWLAAYDGTLAQLVAIETITQRVYRRNTVGENTVTRAMRSEFAWVPVLGGRDVLGVRDVREMDGQAVGESGRLEAILRAPSAERDSRVAALLGESVRLLEVPTAVNFNFPTFALGYLRDANAERAKWSTKDGPSPGLVVLRFKETGRSLVRTPEGRMVRAEGTLIVETATGRVHETFVALNDAHAIDEPIPGTETVRYEARVRFARDTRVREWVPATMEDRYEWRRRSAGSGSVTNALLIDGRSAYTEYRRYATEVRIVPR